MADSKKLIRVQDIDPGGLSNLAQSVLQDAESIAKKLNNRVIGQEHLVVAMARALALDSRTPLSVDQSKKIKDLVEGDIWERRLEFKGSDEDGSDIQVTPEVVDRLRSMTGDEAEKALLSLQEEVNKLPDGLAPRVVSLLEGGSTPAEETGPVDEAVPDSQPEKEEEQTVTEEARVEKQPNVPFAVAAPEHLDSTFAADIPSWSQKMELVATSLQTSSKRAVLVHGKLGSGMRTFVRNLVANATLGRVPGLEKTPFYFLDFKQVRQNAFSEGGVPMGLAQCLEGLAKLKDAVLVIENADLLMRPMFAIPGAVLMQSLVAEGGVRVLMASSDQTERALNTDSGATAFSTHPRSVLSVQLGPCDRTEIMQNLVSYADHIRGESGSISEECCGLLLDALPLINYKGNDIGAAMSLLEEVLAFSENSPSRVIHPELITEYMKLRTGGQQMDVLPGLKDLESRINEVVLSQDYAVGTVVKRLKQTKLKLDQRPERPDGVFLFVGPSGVGKTFLAKALCQSLYGNLDRMIRIDMSEFLESHSIAKLIGSPPGYVGYGEQAMLTGPAAKMGEGILLLDEIEKAHPKVLNLFLQLFDEGFITDSTQNKVMFSDFVVIMTSNLGKDLWESTATRPRLGFEVDKPDDPKVNDPTTRDVENHLLKLIPSEFVNRIDEIVPFNALSVDQLKGIAQHMLQKEKLRWEDRFGKKFTLDPDVADFIGGHDYMPSLGARHLERNIERYIVRDIAELVLDPGWEDVPEIFVAMKGNQISVRSG
jgi:tRNA A37 threonylcarbamoyladenosine biosynthesis protein TsaE